MNSLMPADKEANRPAIRPEPEAASIQPAAVSAPAPAPAVVAAAPGVPALTIKGLSVYFGSHQVLKKVSLDIKARAVTAIIGPSGCGKSTFLRALNRMHELIPEARMEGDIHLFGQNIYGREVEPVIVRRRVGMVFQKSNPFPTMSIAENVTVGLRLNGVRARSVLAERTESALRMVALWDEVKDRLNAPAVSLSGGQQQRLCIARAIVVQPEVILMDEPASALDPLATAKIEALIERDDELARNVMADDVIVDQLELEIDELAIQLLSKAPLATDLRLITVAMKISHDLERVSDEATTIARRSLELSLEPQLKPYVDIPRMASMALDMLKEALDSFVNRNPDKARAIIPRDKEVDLLNKQLHRELSSYMVERPSTITRCLNLMVISKSLERVADHATNVAEEVVYLYEARDIRHTGKGATPAAAGT